MSNPAIDFRAIVAHGGSQRDAFEAFCCHLARRDTGRPPESRWESYNGAGGDGGVECLWRAPDGRIWGYQAKYKFNSQGLKPQISGSFETAIKHHHLSHYVICLPFDPTATTGRGPGTAALLESWREELESAAPRVTVEYWFASELERRALDVDPSGGLRRYYFEGEGWPNDPWFQRHLAGALKRAGPRYTPELHVELPIARALAAVGGTADWTDRIAGQRARLEAAIDRVRTAGWHTHERHGPELDPLRERLSTWVTAAFADDCNNVDIEALQGLQIELGGAIDRLREQLREVHGEDAIDNPSFKQFQAEYMASFPTAGFDAARELAATLNNIEVWFESPEWRAARERTLLVTGPAGAGKTHAVCDFAAQLGAGGVPCLLVFGAQLKAPSWTAMCDALGLDTTWSRDQLFDALQAAAERTQRRLVIIIDAMDESAERGLWRTALPDLLNEVASRDGLSLVVTCRSSYAPRLLPEGYELARVEHPGFGDRTFNAVQSFFDHYNLRVPATPLLTTELQNPLVLTLVCKLLQDTGRTEVPAGWYGFHTLIDALIAHLESEVSSALALATPRRWVATTVRRLARAMAAANHSLTVEACEAIVDGVVPSSHRAAAELFDRLVGWNLLKVDARGDEDIVTFAYAGIGDHLRANAHLDDDTDIGHLVEEAWSSDDMGLLAALAVQLPDKRQIEVLDVVAEGQLRAELVATWLKSFQHRSPKSVADTTLTRLIRRLHTQDAFAATDALIVLGLRPGGERAWHRLHGRLKQTPLGVRDAYWSMYLHQRYERGAGVISLARLLEPRPASQRANDVAVEQRWLMLLGWMTAAADRRVRDGATRAMVALSRPNPQLLLSLERMLEDVDDPYVVERCLLAIYGCLLFEREQIATGTIQRLADLVFKTILADQGRRHVCALSRDHARCILDLAARLGAQVPTGYTPPYESEWDSDFPPESFVAARTEEADSFAEQRLISSCANDDFARYIVDSAVGSWEGPLTQLQARRWILRRAYELGWDPELHLPYDSVMLRRYGFGRSREMFADRLGKKYQWIALWELVARLRDNVPRVPHPWRDDGPLVEDDLIAVGLRQLDPTLTTPDTVVLEKQHPSLKLAEFKLDVSGAADSPDEWLDVQRADDETQHLVPVGDADGSWRVLTSRRSVHLDATKDLRCSRWLELLGGLVAHDDLDRVLARWAGQQLAGSGVGTSGMSSGGAFLGEYPWARAYERLRQPETERQFRSARHDLEAAWEYDGTNQPTRALCVPSALFFELDPELAWSHDGLFFSGGQVAIRSLDAESGTLDGLVVRSDYLDELLRARRFVLVWFAVSEFMVYGRPLNIVKARSRVLWTTGDGVIHGTDPVEERR